mmetsp:Transcript_12893/g.20858  ORF Transcript_12893/g.20858 Transcript_12893/m.20858 type:complete len:103 (-) Transcript_12893:493-801(-)
MMFKWMNEKNSFARFHQMVDGYFLKSIGSQKYDPTKPPPYGYIINSPFREHVNPEDHTARAFLFMTSVACSPYSPVGSILYSNRSSSLLELKICQELRTLSS